MLLLVDKMIEVMLTAMLIGEGVSLLQTFVAGKGNACDSPN